MERSGLCALTLVALSACGGPFSDRAPLPEPSSREVASLAGSESSEPFLSASGDGSVYLSWVERGWDGTHELRMSTLGGFAEGAEWGEPTIVVKSSRLFLNWADLPSVVAGPDESLWAHWLERSPGGGYGVRVARSGDAGASWSAAWTPHGDSSSAEHGFVTAVPIGDGVGFAWLDGRGMASAAETALYFRVMGPEGPSTPESVIDPRACDCCQTDAAMTESGPVLVYRDRSPEEVRDIRITRWSGGAWSEPELVHADGWETGACPVNGPAVDARGDRVVVAWFTAADGVPRVQVAFSDDSAGRFGDPAVVDDGDPAGRVDAVMLDDGSALVSWLERTDGDWSEVRVRRVAPDARTSVSVGVSAGRSERVSGVPRMARASAGTVWLAWTDATETLPRVRVARIDVQAASES